jgi:hypothetical protein
MWRCGAEAFPGCWESDVEALRRLHHREATSLACVNMPWHIMLSCIMLSTLRCSLVQVVGVSFHVGSGCQNVGVYADAISAARQVRHAVALLLLDCCCTGLKPSVITNQCSI